MAISSIASFNCKYGRAIKTIFLLIAITILISLVGCEAMDAFIANNPTVVDNAEGTAATVGSFIPPPYNIIFTGVTGILIGLVRARQRKQQLDRTVKAIDSAKNSAIGGPGVIDFNNPATVKLLQDAMGSSTRKAVNQAQSNTGLIV